MSLANLGALQIELIKVLRVHDSARNGPLPVACIPGYTSIQRHKQTHNIILLFTEERSSQ